MWLFVGVNGVGKTTTIGKIARQQQDEGRRVIMAAGDTFRAAAAEQLGQWAERTGSEMVRGNEGGDPSAVVFDAKWAGRGPGPRPGAGRHRRAPAHQDQPHGGAAEGRRVADRDPGNVTEVLLVMDATTGQNGLAQAASSPRLST